LSRFTVSWLPPYPPYGPHDRYKLQYQHLSSSPNDWKSIEVDSRSRELECPVSLKFLFSLKMGRAQNRQEVINQLYDIDVSVMLPIFFKRLQVPGPRLCYNITGLDQGQQYRVKVAAHIEGGNYGPFSQIGKSSSDLKYF